jgi:cysteine-S-conjugate beta-lyase
MTETELIHHAYAPPAGFAAPQPGIYKASTVFFPHLAAMRAHDWACKNSYSYGLHGTPTTFILEERLAALEGASHCLLVPSGLAAIALVMQSLLQSGDEILIPENVYGPAKTLAEAELKQWGVTHQFYDPMDPQDLAQKLSARTRLVWLEAPGSVTLEFPDLTRLTRLCRERGIWTALDHTWGAGLAFGPFDWDAGQGVDICVHALTKYPSGGGDVLMGSVSTRLPAVHARLKKTHMHLGLGVGANDAETLLRSLPSMALRYRAQDEAARTLARWCSTQDAIAQVLHPALPGSPGHQNWLDVCGPQGLAAGIFSVIFKPDYTPSQTDAFCESLKRFRLGYSWGGPVSLVVPYELAPMRTRWPRDLARGRLVRLAVGLEAVSDLQNDLAQALAAMQAHD